MTAWDPIGVGDVPEAWDEYDEYASGIAQRLRDTPVPDRAAELVAARLGQIESDSMEIAPEGDRLANRRLAEALVAWHEWSFARSGQPPSRT